MRVGILALLHESNTFISEATTLDHFQQNMLLTGEAIRERMADSHHEIGGFFAGLEPTEFEAVPIFAARAVPYGTIDAECFQHLLDCMFAELDAAGSLDGILVAPHGATVSQRHRDADGYWLRLLRQRVGPHVPVIGTLDPHANLSPMMVESCDALIAYRSNPHLDQRQRGIEAATLMARTLRREVTPAMAAAFPPMAVNIERQLTSEPQWQPLYAMADEMLGNPRVLTNSIFLGFPYADVAEMGSSVLVVTDNDTALAEELARSMGDELWRRRQDFVGQMLSIEAALDRCEQSDGPLCLLDMGDNVGGGSPADSTFLAHAIVQRRLPRSFVCLFDPAAVQQCVEAGIGQRRTLEVGGKTDGRHGAPLKLEFTITGLHDGQFEEPEPRHGGFTHCDQGQTAVIESDTGLTVMLTSRRMPPFSLRQLTSCGLDPTSFHILVAKGVNAPVAAYAPVCRELLRVNTPGVTAADMVSLNYQYRRKPLFPFEEFEAAK